MQSDRNFFDILNICPTNDFFIIKEAYKKQARLCHPDKREDKDKAHLEFIELANALEILSDDNARELYYQAIINGNLTHDDFRNIFFHSSPEKYSNVGETWVREDGYNIFKKVYYHNRKISYRHKSNNDSRYFNIYGFADGSIVIMYENPSLDLFNELMVQRSGFTNFNSNDKRSVGLGRTISKEKLLEVMFVINKHDPLSEIRDEIFHFLGLPIPIYQNTINNCFLVFKKYDDEDKNQYLHNFEVNRANCKKI